MPLFHYKILKKDGTPSEGTSEAKDKFALYHVLKQDGSTVISASEVKEKKGIQTKFISDLFGGVKAHDKILFARNLAKMLDAGLPVTRGLSIIERESNGQFKKIIKSLNESISKGTTLSDGMLAYPKVFSKLFVSMTKAGEESGNLSPALQNISVQMEKTYQLNRKIRGALMYPAIILCLMVVIGVLMMVYMVPTLTSTFTGLGVALPLSTRIIIAVSNFLISYFVYAFLGVVALVGLFIYFLRSTRGQRTFDFVLLHMPIIKNLVKQINSARTARTLSSLLSSGVDIVVAIGVTKDVVQNSYYKSILDEIQVVIQKGGAISSVFSAHVNLYPVFVAEMVSVGEETGKVGDMFQNVAAFYEEEIDQKTKDLSSIIEPFLMIFIGLAVGFFAVAVIGPIYSLSNSIN